MPETPAAPLRYGTIDPTYARRLATTPAEEDGPVWMINLMAYRPRADYADGRSAGLTGREADDRYAPLEALAAVGAEVALFADVDDQLLGDAPRWDRVAVVKYPTRRAFIDMQARPEFVEKHAHKEAGMAQTIILGGQPFAPPVLPEDAPEWSTVPHPSTDEDGPVLATHVIRFHDGQAATAMLRYQDAAGAVAVPHGVRTPAWFTVEGTIVGDGRAWDQVRFNAFPSKAAFMAVVFDPERQRAHRAHRETAIADTYTLVLRPSIDRLAASVSP